MSSSGEEGAAATSPEDAAEVRIEEDGFFGDEGASFPDEGGEVLSADEALFPAASRFAGATGVVADRGGGRPLPVLGEEAAPLPAPAAPAPLLGVAPPLVAFVPADCWTPAESPN